MNKNKKIIILSLVPGLLTLVFAIYVTFPGIQHLKSSYENLQTEKKAMEQTQSSLSSLKRNDKLLNELFELRNHLYDFDVKVPTTDDMAVLLVDFDKIARAHSLKISSFKTRPRKNVDMTDNKPGKKKSRKSRKPETPALQLVSIPVETGIVGNYPNILKFIKDIEKYQRKVIVRDVAIKDYKDDKELAAPRVEVTLSYTIYKTEKPQIPQEE